MMARRKANPFADRIRKLPYRALIKRDEPFARADDDEIAATCARIAAGADYCSFAGSRGSENGCKVLCFDTPEKACEMQSWIDASGIAARPLPRMDDRAGRLGPIQWEASKGAK